MPEPYKLTLDVYPISVDPFEVHGQIYEDDRFLVWDEDGEMYDASYDLDREEATGAAFVYWSPISLREIQIISPRFWAKIPDDTFEEMSKNL